MSRVEVDALVGAAADHADFVLTGYRMGRKPLETLRNQTVAETPAGGRGRSLTREADSCYGRGVLIERLHQTVAAAGVEDVDQAVPARRSQQIQT